MPPSLLEALFLVAALITVVKSIDSLRREERFVLSLTFGYEDVIISPLDLGRRLRADYFLCASITYSPRLNVSANASLFNKPSALVLHSARG